MSIIFILQLATLYRGAVILMCVALSLIQIRRWSITAQMVSTKLNIPTPSYISALRTIVTNTYRKKGR